MKKQQQKIAKPSPEFDYQFDQIGNQHRNLSKQSQIQENLGFLS